MIGNNYMFIGELRSDCALLDQRKMEGFQFRYKNLYKKTHTFQSESSKGQFNSEKSQQTMVNALCEQYSRMESTYSTHLSVSDDKELFVEVAGAFKKGHVLGLGSESFRVRRRLEQDSSSTQSTPSVCLKPVDIEARIRECVMQQVGL